MLKSSLMYVVILLIGVLAYTKFTELDNEKRYEQTREKSRELLRSYNISEEEIENIVMDADRKLRFLINFLIFFFLFVLFLMAKFSVGRPNASHPIG